MNEVRAAYDAAEQAARTSYGKLLAYLAKRCGSVDAAQDALCDAFAAALERWPLDGIPQAPQAWLLVAARHRIVDGERYAKRTERLHDRLVVAARDAQVEFEQARELADERLDLMFACAHPAVAPHIRAPLMLQVVLGLDAARIAAVYLVAPATMSQRLVRAKQKIAVARIPLRTPPADRWSERLDDVLAAIYVAFTQGWNDPHGSDTRTRGFASEAIWLGRIVAGIYSNEPEILGLLALMLHADARRAARRDVADTYVPLDEQDVALWNAAAIDEAESLLARASKGRRIGRFQLEAAIQSAHAARRHGRAPDWAAIVSLYDELLRRTGSPVIGVNRAVAVGRAFGAKPGLDALTRAAADPRLQTYQPYWAARADLLARAGNASEARGAYLKALEQTADPAIRRYLRNRLKEVEASGSLRYVVANPVRE